jgi:hypothetical protein
VAHAALAAAPDAGDGDSGAGVVRRVGEQADTASVTTSLAAIAAARELSLVSRREGLLRSG